MKFFESSLAIQGFCPTWSCASFSKIVERMKHTNPIGLQILMDGDDGMDKSFSASMRAFFNEDGKTLTYGQILHVSDQILVQPGNPR